jgi:signal peptidase II
LALLIVFIIDQYIKYIFEAGYRLNGECISLILVYNKGVAFSMFSFLEHYLKYIQIVILIGVFIYFISDKIIQNHKILTGILFGAGISNIIDRFFREGVVDYVYWHCGFDFAIFNFADVMIDFSVFGLILSYFLVQWQNKKLKKDN